MERSFVDVETIAVSDFVTGVGSRDTAGVAESTD